MAFYTLFVVLIAFSAVGYSNGDEHCEEDKSNTWDTKICKNKPDSYKDYQRDIDRLIEQDQHWEGFKQLKQFKPEADIFKQQQDEKLSGDYENCRAVTTTEIPYLLKRDNVTHIVVQSEFLQQRINVTKCKDIESKCLSSVFPNPNTKCVEKTGAMSLYIYDAQLNKLVYRSFNFPVCCTCKFLVPKLQPGLI